MYTVTLRVYDELNEFLPLDKRQQSFPVSSRDRRAVKDLIESQGVPHTEIAAIRVNGEWVQLTYRIDDGDRIGVYPCVNRLGLATGHGLRRPPEGLAAFVADVNLGKLSRNLRLLGLDCVYDNQFDDREVIRIGVAENRIILTRDRGLLQHKTVIHGIYIHASNPILQTREVLRRIDLGKHIRPCSRCVRCNGLIIVAPKDSVRGFVPRETFQNIDEFYRCVQCGKLYWRGAHWHCLQEIIAAVCAALPVPNGWIRMVRP